MTYAQARKRADDIASVVQSRRMPPWKAAPGVGPRFKNDLMCYVDSSGEARKKDAADPGPGYSCLAGPGVVVSGDLGIWTPGNEPTRMPEGVARSLPAGADIILQPHYHPTGKPEVDRTRVGLHFSRIPIKRTVHWNAATDLHMKLPADNSNIEVRGEWPIPVDMQGLAVLGSGATVVATEPPQP